MSAASERPVGERGGAERAAVINRIAPSPGDAVVAFTRTRRPLRKRLRLPLMLLAPLVVLVGAAYVYATSGRYESTDDAYVRAARASISANVSGRVIAIAVHDNQQVKRGQVLYRIDPRPFSIAVEDAGAQLAGARLKVQSLKATYRQKLADLHAAEDTLAYQQSEFARQKRLLANGVSSQAQFDERSHALEVARQQVASDQQQIASVLASLGGNPDLPVDSHPTVEQAQAALDQAKLNLSYTVIDAPDDGVVTKVDQLQIGDYVTAGTPVFALVSTSRVWIEANFKETELTHMRPGQSATIDIDTYPDRSFAARVASLSPGTGSVFSLLPPENASGNWVKVVQRLPVRLTIDDIDPARPLHAGLSATVEVDTGFRRPILRWLKGLLGLSGRP